MFKKLLLLIVCFSLQNLSAQQDKDTVNLRNLPFYIDPVKRMPDVDLKDKKEGTFITGLPRVEFDPIRGFGAGGNVNLFINKDESDPFFEYTPYRHRVNAEFFVFENGRVRYEVSYDAPYIFDSPWRLRADAVYWEDPEAQYWGVGRSTLNRLSFADKSGGNVGPQRTFKRINDYESNLEIAIPQEDGSFRTDFHYNQIIQREHLYNLLGERVLMGGKMRIMFGYEMLFTQFESYNGRIADEARTADGESVDAINNPTLVDIHRADGTWDQYNLAGFGDDRWKFTSMLAGALIYDTRDFEPDPSKGVFLQYSHEWSVPELGSDFSFNKFMLQGQVFKTLSKWKGGKRRITFAGMASLGHIWGSNINFIEMYDLSSQAEAGGILVLGGERSLRGFREARMLAPTVGLINLEMRTRLYDFKMLGQEFILGVTPFFDAGTVWEGLDDIQLNGFRGSAGLGGRIAWNQSTVLRLDYAQSREGSQVFFGFGHIF
ncbi:MAG: outer membrane protein assembly factor [Flavobacteriaceae bacterium]|nr:outer membrane protein assembly factor [Flavobacteriaceae bacterium]